MLTNQEFNDEVKAWSGTELNWNEDDVVWTATQDDGTILKYLESVVKRIHRECASYRAERERNGYR